MLRATPDTISFFLCPSSSYTHCVLFFRAVRFLSCLFRPKINVESDATLVSISNHYTLFVPTKIWCSNSNTLRQQSRSTWIA